MRGLYNFDRLVEAVRTLAKQLADSRLLEARLRRRLLIPALLVAYLDERSVLLAKDFARARKGATHFLSNGVED